MSVSPSNSILQIAERSFLMAFENCLKSVVSGAQIPVLISDEATNKPEMPYIVARCKQAEEIISPGCGIFKVTAEAIYRSHVKATTPNQREIIVNSLNNFAYTNPANTLSQPTGFHCYGFVPKTGSMVVDQETKSYSYEIEWAIYCMPRGNN